MSLLRFGSLSLSDSELIAAMEDCAFAPAEFHHGDHLRLAWILLHCMPVEAALTETRRLIQAFANHHGKAHAYHETITKAWVLMLASHDESSFEDFVRIHGQHLSADLLHRHWTPSILASNDARVTWIPPDIGPLPAIRYR